MRRLFLISNLLFISFYCFAQQNLPGKIIGKIPDKNSPAIYQIQVGAFTVKENAERAVLQLTKNALNPVSEQYLNFTRVMIKGISANQVTDFLAIIKRAGFNEVIIREDTAAARAQTMPFSPELELLCQTWRVINCTERENIGSQLVISNTGTFLFTMPDGTSNNLSDWRWYDDTNEEFEYSHDNWDHYGRARITNLTKDSLEIFDPGLFNTIYGYSNAGMDIQWELVPVSD
jgi:hypothetical protein